MMEINQTISYLKKLKFIQNMGEGYMEVWETLCKAYAKDLDEGATHKPIAFTLHDFSHHCVDIYKIINELPVKDLNQEECFVLAVAVLMHDYSMSQEGTERERHSEISAELVRELFLTDSVWESVHINLQEMIPLLILAHSDTKNPDGTRIRHLESGELTNNHRGHFENIDGKYLGAVLRLADAMDVTRERLGKYYKKLPKLNEDDNDQNISLMHWRKLTCFKAVEVKKPKIILTIDDNEKILGREEKLSLIKEVRSDLLKELNYVNEQVFQKSGLFATDVFFESSKKYEQTELLDIPEDTSTNCESEKSEFESTEEKNQTAENIAEEEAETEETTAGEYQECNLDEKEEVGIINAALERKVTNYIFDQNLLVQGHYRMNQLYCGKDWIDVRQLICDKDMGFDIVSTMAEDISKLNYDKQDTIIVGISVNGNILASQIAFDLHLSFSYILPSASGEHGSIQEQKVDVAKYSNIILVAGVIATGGSLDTILDIIPENKIKKIYTVFYRSIQHKKMSYKGKIRAVNSQFDADIVEEAQCMLKRHNRCIAVNAAVYSSLKSDAANLDIVSGDAERIFLNTSIGCNAKCRYCYMDKLLINKQNKRSYDKDEVLKRLLSMPEFEKGDMGTILTLGCYAECWSKDNRQDTMDIICELVEYENPIQIATKKHMDKEDIEYLARHLKRKQQLFIYISIPTISQSGFYEKGTDAVDLRIRNFELNKISENVQFVLYIRPVLTGVTIKDLDQYKGIMEQYKIPCVVGDMLKENKNGTIDKKMVGDGRLREEKVAEADDIMEQLKPYGPVYRHSTELINDIRRKTN